MKKIYEFNYYYDAIDVYEVNSIYKYYWSNHSWIGEFKTSVNTMFYSLSISNSPIYLKCEVSFFEEGVEFLFSMEEKYFYAYDEIESCFNHNGYIVFVLKESIKRSSLEIETPFIMYRNFDEKVLENLKEILSNRVENCTINFDKVDNRFEKQKFIIKMMFIILAIVMVIVILFITIATPPNEFRTLKSSSNILAKQAKTIKIYEKGLAECYGKYEGKGCGIIAEKLLNLKSNYNLNVMDFNRVLERSEWDSCTKKNSSGLYDKIIEITLPKECAVYKTFSTLNEMK